VSAPKPSPTRPTAAGRTFPAAVLLLGLTLILAACGAGRTPQPSASPALGGPSSSGPSQRAASRPASSPAAHATRRADCVDRAMAGLSDSQRVGQLLMTRVSASGMSRAEWAALRDNSVGSVILMGPTTAGVGGVRAVTERVRSAAVSAGGSTVGLLTAVDQEGGLVQVLKGPGFSVMPDAVAQGRWPASLLEARAAAWGRQLRAAGVTVDLAPVADVVPDEVGSRNKPIGALSREYGSSPATVSRQIGAFVRGLTSAGVAATVKHFPGLGAVRGNTDFSAGVIDDVTARGGPALAPFRDGTRAGARFTMVSLATYTRIDPARPAVFSPVVLRAMLRGDLGFDGVIVSDDLGDAAAVRSVPPGRRAVRFLAAGGDMVLTVDPATVGPMTSAVLSRMRYDAGFRRGVGASVRRVLIAKRDAGLLRCGS
jgi:beta-N-acetylhexosaminidase